MEKFVNLFLSGAVSGGIYAVMAAGLVLTYQTSGMFNFAHGAVAFVTAYFFYQLNFGQDIPAIPAAIIAVFIFAPLLGLALDRILLRRLATAPVYARIVGTIGLLIALPALAIWLVETFSNTILELGLPTNTGTGTGGGVVRGLGPFPARGLAPRLHRAPRRHPELRPGGRVRRRGHRRGIAVVRPAQDAPRSGDARRRRPRGPRRHAQRELGPHLRGRVRSSR